MTVLEGVLLGIVQGLTEFLPVSSSGHLALLQSTFKDFHQPGLLFDTLLHCATLLAVLTFFRKRIVRLFYALFGIISARYKIYYYEERNLLWGIVIATIPTALIAFALKDITEALFEKPAAIGYFLILTSVMLFLSDRLNPAGNITPLRALIVGIIQGLAVFPGISRSGSTIFAALQTGVARGKAAEFSFLISVPAILGATLLQAQHVSDVSPSAWPAYVAGMAAAFIFGLLAIGVMMKVVKSARLSGFALYCLILGICAILWI